MIRYPLRRIVPGEAISVPDGRGTAKRIFFLIRPSGSNSLWLLTRGRHNRVFQEKRVIDIVESVFADYRDVAAWQWSDGTRFFTRRWAEFPIEGGTFEFTNAFAACLRRA